MDVQIIITYIDFRYIRGIYPFRYDDILKKGEGSGRVSTLSL